MEVLRKKLSTAVAICNGCAEKWNSKDSADVSLMRCSRCKWTFYCSPVCQRGDWKSHKKDCVSQEKLVNTDDIWSPLMTRKGTEYIGVDWGTA